MPPTTPPRTHWRTAHAGHWLRLAHQRFEARVLALMAQHPQVPLGLSRLAANDQVGAAILHITRHLDPQGMRLVDLAAAAAMTKQAMGALVTQCEAWGLVQRSPHPHDARARSIRFTDTGLAWLQACELATAQAEDEMRAAMGTEVCTVVTLGLEAYSAQ
ncbi:MAG: MarR family transcriptional regulator [Rhodoferax sp.]|nr:MAG: MarR family transcriptional regulator [Rhodoferax sp.]